MLKATTAKVGSKNEWSLQSGIILIGLTLTSFFNYTDRMAISVLIEPIKTALSITDTQVGLLTGFAFALFYAMMGVPIGRLADTRNKAKILVFCFLMWSVMTGLSGLATSFAALFFLRLMVGVGEAGCLPTSFAIISERFSAHQRPLAISVFQAGGRLGVALGMAGAGIAGQFLGWRLALVAIGVCGVPAALLVALSLRGSQTKARAHRAATAPAKAKLADILGVPGLLPLIAAISLASFATYGITQWLPAFFIRHYGASLSASGVWNGLAGGIGGIIGTLGGGLAAGRLVRRNPNWDLWLPSVSYAAAAPLFIAAVMSPTIAMAAAFNLAATLVATSGSGVALAAIQRFTKPASRATANALMLMISALTGVGLGPVAVGFLSDRLHPTFGAASLQYALAIAACAFFGSCLCFLWAGRSAKRLSPELAA
jgi:predicted MFS family arabinose efflux permease